jgi:hypothetical protein
MKSEKLKLVAVLSVGLLTAAIIIVLPARRVTAQAPGDPTAVEFTADGYQASSTSRLVLNGKIIGNNAKLTVLTGPILAGNPQIIPPQTDLNIGNGFPGASCTADYSEDLITTDDPGTGTAKESGNTLRLNVFGYRCDIRDGKNSHIKNGVYSVVGGTGNLQQYFAGTGNITFDVHSDGSAIVHLQGNVMKNSPILEVGKGK